ncbi:MAG: N-acetyltransferase family protein [Ferruginibacter sp.]
MFRDTTIDDLRFVTEVYNATIPSRLVTADTTPLTSDDIAAWWKATRTDRPFWIIEHQEERIGWVRFRDFYGRPGYRHTAEIAIYIHPAHQGKGWGAKALQQAIDSAPALQIHTLLGFIFAQNEPSLSLFRSFGFTCWGHLPNIALLDNRPCSLEIWGKSLQ